MAKSKPSFGAKADETEKVEHDGHCHEELDAKIEALEGKVSDLENKLKGLLDGIDAASKLKNELDEAKLKLSSEVNELKEKAKSWSEKADTNKDGQLSLSEIYEYIVAQQKRRR